VVSFAEFEGHPAHERDGVLHLGPDFDPFHARDDALDCGEE
jgi:hypothetical protein